MSVSRSRSFDPGSIRLQKPSELLHATHGLSNKLTEENLTYIFRRTLEGGSWTRTVSLSSVRRLHWLDTAIQLISSELFEALMYIESIVTRINSEDMASSPIREHTAKYVFNVARRAQTQLEKINRFLNESRDCRREDREASLRALSHLTTMVTSIADILREELDMRTLYRQLEMAELTINTTQRTVVCKSITRTFRRIQSFFNDMACSDSTGLRLRSSQPCFVAFRDEYSRDKC